MNEINEKDYIQTIDGLYTYSVNCPSCQISPDCAVDNTAAIDCTTCAGLGEITLKMTEEDLSDIYQEYFRQSLQSQSPCPSAYQHSLMKIDIPSNLCPMTRTAKEK